MKRLTMSRNALAAAGMALALTACGEPQPLYSDTINTGYPFCLTEDALDQLTDAETYGNASARDRLMATACFPSFRDGVEYEIIETTMTRAHLSVTAPNGKALDVWTYLEAIMGSKS